MTDKNFDDVIDPDENIAALQEAMGQPVAEEVMILSLLNGRRVKVRYLPQSIASSLEFDDGTPIQVQTRKPKFNFRKWAKEVIPKLNALALRNNESVNDMDGTCTRSPRAVRLSLISPGEFRRLNQLCFPGASEDWDSSDEDNVPDRKNGKGLRGRESSSAGD